MAKDARSALSEDARGKIEKLIGDAVNALDGYEIVEIRYTKEYGKFNLTVFIWHEDEVTLDDCEKVHNAVSDALDAAEDLFPADYVLNVSSSGLDRPIVTDDDFRRAMGTEIEAVAPECTYRGTLTAYTADSFTIESAGKYQKEKHYPEITKPRCNRTSGFRRTRWSTKNSFRRSTFWSATRRYPKSCS